MFFIEMVLISEYIVRNHKRASSEWNVISTISQSIIVKNYIDRYVYSGSVSEASPLQELFQNVCIVRCAYVYGIQLGYQKHLIAFDHMNGNGHRSKNNVYQHKIHLISYVRRQAIVWTNAYLCD